MRLSLAKPVLVSAAALAVGTVLSAEERALARPTTAQEVLWQIGRRIQEIDTDGDGKPDLFRRWHPDGRLQEIRYRSLFQNRYDSFTSVTFEPQLISTTVTTAGTTVQKSYETTRSSGQVIKRLEYEKSDVRLPDFDIRREAFAKGSHWIVREYRLRGKKSWTLAQEKRFPRFQEYEGNRREYDRMLRRRDQEISRRIAQCRSSDPRGANPEGGCPGPDVLPAPPESLGELFRDSCVDGELIYLNNGFSIHHRSCPSQEAQRRITEATEDIAESIQCLRRVNPRFGNAVLHRVARLRPTFYCSGLRNPHRLRAEDVVCEGLSGTDLEDCQAYMAATNERAAAYVIQDHPGSIFLARRDPQAASSAEESNPFSTTWIGQQTLSSTSFHELLHSCNHPADEEHGTQIGDEIYGCEALCGDRGGHAKISREGCLACVRAEGGRPSARQIAACNQFPPSLAYRALSHFETGSTRINTCLYGQEPNRQLACQAILHRHRGQGACEGTQLAPCVEAARQELQRRLVTLLENASAQEFTQMLAYRAAERDPVVGPSGEISVVTQPEAVDSQTQRYASLALAALCRPGQSLSDVVVPGPLQTHSGLASEIARIRQTAGTQDCSSWARGAH